MAHYFLSRPVFASVLSILIVVAGLLALPYLAVQQYPQIIPPQVKVSASYSGATAQAASESVAAPLELYLNGVENLLYMTSSADDSGSVSITLLFKIGTDVDQAAIDVESAVQRALSRLPEDTQKSGIQISKESDAILKIISLRSPDGSRDSLYLNNYANLTVQKELARIDGVAKVTYFGSKTYAMRIWLRPDQLADYGLTPDDVRQAVLEQNNMYTAGAFGEAPNPENAQELTFSIATEGRLSQVSEFENIILRSDEHGAIVYLSDVARVELGATNYDFDALLNGETVVPMGIVLRPGANALEVSKAVDASLEQMSRHFPQGVDYSISFDTTSFVKVSIQQVVKTLFEALLLVSAVMFLFLQNWRATLICLLSIPVSLIGVFAGMYLFGFSLNLLTLLALVLSIGIVVDDSIVVIENIERYIEQGVAPYQAAQKAMMEVSGPIITMVLILAAVFVPVAFLGGVAGVMYQQFALTITLAVFLSGVVALSLTPALCVTLLRPSQPSQLPVLRQFNVLFNRMAANYSHGVRFILRRLGLASLVVGGLIVLSWSIISVLPSTLVPSEDQGYLLVSHRLPEGASLDRTHKFSVPWNHTLQQGSGTEHALTFIGYDLLNGGRQSNVGASFITLEDWKKRKGKDQNSFSLAEQLNQQGQDYPEAVIRASNPPSIAGMSSTSGIEGYITLVSEGELEQLHDFTQEVIARAQETGLFSDVRTSLRLDIPRYTVEVDKERAKAMGVKINDIYSTMGAVFGRKYINDFTYLGRAWRVYLSAESAYRESPEKLSEVYVRSGSGDMIPLHVLVNVHRSTGPDRVDRYNSRPAARVIAEPKVGVSQTKALRTLESLVTSQMEQATVDFQLYWTGSIRQEMEDQSTAGFAFGFALFVVFLFLAAQYERWTLPFAVLTAIPFALFGASLGTWLLGLENTIYFQVGLLVLIGLAAKNAILIVEFAAQYRHIGYSALRAALLASQQRFRPIIMTSIAFILGALPLLFASGAGAASRVAVGATVVFGMVFATFIAVVFIPVFYVGIENYVSRFKSRN